MPAKRCGVWTAMACAWLAAVTAGCGPPNPMQRTINAMQGCADLLAKVTDAESARAAIPEIKPTFTEFGDSTRAFAEAMSDPRNALSFALKAAKLGPELERASTEFEQESTRLESLKGLPVEFWNAYRLEDYRAASSLESLAQGEVAEEGDAAMFGAISQVVSMLEQHGGERTVEFDLTNISVGDKDAAIARITELAGPGAQVVNFEDPEDYEVWGVVVAPVEDFDKLVADVDFGKVVDSDKARSGIVVELAPAEAESMAALGVTPVAAPADAAAAQTAPMDGAPPATDPAMGTDPAATDPAMAAYDGRGGPMPMADGGYPAADPAAAGVPGAPDVGANVRQWLTSLAAAQQVAFPPGSGGMPRPTSPHYHAQLAELLFDAQAQHHEMAVMTLLEIKPADVPDKKVRGRIAQGYRYVALESGAHPAEGVRGLVMWGGKYSAPILIQMLEQSTMGAEEAVYAGLGQIATPEAADAVVARVGMSGASSEAAWTCLRQMGPVAEASLVAALPFEAADANLAAIVLLGEIGTKKSAAILRLATKSESEDVATAALDAIRAIRDRQRQASASATEAE